MPQIVTIREQTNRKPVRQMALKTVFADISNKGN